MNTIFNGETSSAGVSAPQRGAAVLRIMARLALDAQDAKSEREMAEIFDRISDLAGVLRDELINLAETRELRPLARSDEDWGR